MRTSVRKTSLNSASPVICRSGRTSTPGRGHVADEVGDALVLGHARVGAGEQDRPPRLVRHRGPDLLTGDDPVVAVAHRAGAERGEVGAGAGLAEELAPHLLAGPQRTQPAPPLLVGAVAQDRRRRHAEPDADPPWLVVGRAGRGELARRRPAAARRGAPSPPSPPGSAPRRARRRSGPAGSRAGRPSRDRASARN